jgi:hypothetical protein
LCSQENSNNHLGQQSDYSCSLPINDTFPVRVRLVGMDGVEEPSDSST